MTVRRITPAAVQNACQGAMAAGVDVGMVEVRRESEGDVIRIFAIEATPKQIGTKGGNTCDELFGEFD